MHHVEGAQCGLPLLYHEDGGGVVEAGLKYGVGFRDDVAEALCAARDRLPELRAVHTDATWTPAIEAPASRAARAWTREQAITYMMDNTGMAETDVTAEIERYFVDPGQALAYKAGMLKILELRERVLTPGHPNRPVRWS